MLILLQNLTKIFRGGDELIWGLCGLGILLWLVIAQKKKLLSWVLIALLIGIGGRLTLGLSSSRYTISLQIFEGIFATFFLSYLWHNDLSLNCQQLLRIIGIGVMIGALAIACFKLTIAGKKDLKYRTFLTKLHEVSKNCRRPLLIGCDSHISRYAYYTGMSFRKRTSNADSVRRSEITYETLMAHIHAFDLFLLVFPRKQAEKDIQIFSQRHPEIQWRKIFEYESRIVYGYYNDTNALGTPYSISQQLESDRKLGNDFLNGGGNFEKIKIYQIADSQVLQTFKNEGTPFLQGKNWEMAESVTIAPLYVKGFPAPSWIGVTHPGIIGNSALQLKDGGMVVFRAPLQPGKYRGELLFRGEQDSRFEVFFLYNGRHRSTTRLPGGCIASNECRKFVWTMDLTKEPGDRRTDYHLGLRTNCGNVIFDEVILTKEN